MMKNNSKDKIALYIFKYFWIIALLPKMVQFAVFVGIFIVLWNNRFKQLLKNDKTISLFIFGLFCQILAVVLQIVLGNADFSRVLATINTISMWFLALSFYKYFVSINFTKEKIDLITKYIIINLFILFVIYLFSLVYKRNDLIILGHRLPLRHLDYIDGKSSYRFSGFLETQLAVPHLYILSIPILLISNCNKKIRIAKYVAVILGLICVVNSHSRIGLVAGIISVSAIFFYEYIIKKMKGKAESLIYLFVFLSVLVVLFFYYDKLYSVIDNLLNGRKGSNNARFTIYEMSLNKMFSENPIIGIGIKYMITRFSYPLPYGSHSTYIGILYKTGIVGAAFFTCGFISVIKNIHVKWKDTSKHFSILCCILSYFIFLVFADIDGINWVLILAFSTLGLLANKSITKPTNIIV